ncbi:MAG: thymidine phosphorylase, partial [Candidatus Wukongarchaeota archaeon]|nr:thymidine phosphorylase [Candidatus Wukongarchaeota archaeon]
DPLLLPSIMSKKKSVGATHVVIDIPTGIEAKVKTRSDARTLAYDFIDLGKRLGIDVQCAVTFGEQPLGQAIGPALEAKEALSTIMGNGPADLREKVISIAGVLFEMIGIKNGKEKALNLLKSGKAEKKLREIIEAQGGDPGIKPEDVKVGDKKEAIRTIKEGRILWINNKKIAQVAKEAGAPKEKGAGVKLMLKLGEYARKDEVLFEIYAERSSKLEAAVQLAKNLQPVRLSKKLEERMLMDRIPKKTVRKKIFMLER